MATLTTRATELLGVTHPVVLGGMGGGTSPELVAAVSNAGGLGICAATLPEAAPVSALAAAIRERTDRPFGLNLLLFAAGPAVVQATLDARPPVLSTAWGAPEYDLGALFAAAHERGSVVMHMASTLDEAIRAEAAGADLVVAQGTEGGGHVGTMGSTVIVRLAARRLACPVLAAGGFADGAGLAAALVLGAEGVLMGTRFLATDEAPLHPDFKRVILGSDGHSTVLTEIPDIASARVWPGALARVTRNRFIEDWLGRENELRRERAVVAGRLDEARSAGDPAYAVLYAGQTAGLIDSIQPAGEVVRGMVADAVEILRRLGGTAAG